MRHALVTGGAGFICSHLIDELLAAGGCQVTVIDIFDPFYDAAVTELDVGPHPGHPHYRLVRGVPRAQ